MNIKSFIIFVFLIFFPLSLFSSQRLSCENLFKQILNKKPNREREGFSLRDLQKQVDKEQTQIGKQILPQFIDISEEKKLVKYWDKRIETPAVITNLLPKKVYSINHRVRESQMPFAVKIPAQGATLMLRAHYKSQGKNLATNVSLSNIGLMDNKLSQKKKWLVGPSVKAAILFLHGGGTKSTGGHVAESLVNHFNRFNIAVLGPDLPWHGEGPRTFMGTLAQEMQALSDFVKTYVHPDVPLFVMGHSWGGSFAHSIMQTIEKDKAKDFHNSLSGLIISSPAVDPAPGQSVQQKHKVAKARQSQMMKKQNEVAPGEVDLLKQMVADGKTSPIGNLFASITIDGLDDRLPDHRGEKYLPTLMMVGIGDSLVYLGFEDLFHNYYDQLKNVETHYLDEGFLIKERSQKERVGHLLGDYFLKPESKKPVNFELSLNFLFRVLGEEIKEIDKKEKSNQMTLLKLLQLWTNDLSFRAWVEQARIVKSGAFAHDFHVLKEKQSLLTEILNEKIPPLLPKVRLKELLLKIQKGEGEVKDIKLYQARLSDKKLAKNLSSFKESSKDEAVEFATKTLKEKESFFTVYKKDITGFLKNMIFPYKDIKELERDWDTKYQNTISKEEKAFIFPDIQELFNLLARMKQEYIPSYSDYQGEKLSKEVIDKKITNLQNNIKQRKEIVLKLQIQFKEKDYLQKELKTNFLQIEGDIAYIKLLFEKATLNPPASLVQEAKESEEDLLELQAFSEEMEEHLDDNLANKIRSVRSDQLLIEEKDIREMVEPHEDKIKQFVEKYDSYIKTRKKFRQKFIQAILKGEFNSSKEKQEEQVAQRLYGENGLYKETEQLSLSLSQVEAEVQQLKEERLDLIEEYNKNMPHAPISHKVIIDIKKILNLLGDEEYLQNHQSELQEIISFWRSHQSKILPALPE